MARWGAATVTDEQDFIRRWSRRKRAARHDTRAADRQPAEESPDKIDEAATAENEATASSDSPETGESVETAEAAIDLPDIDSLSADSDFTPFMKAGVPKEIRNRALRKLWRVNPAFGHLDGLNDYDGDFTDAATVVKGLKTLYKVGRGFMREPTGESVDEPPPEMADDEPVAEEAPDIAAAPPPEEPEPAPDSPPATKGNKVT